MGEQRRILIADDCERDAYLIVRHLRKLGCQAQFCRAESSKEATEALELSRQPGGLRFDGLILDYCLRAAEGLPVIRFWRSRGLTDGLLVAVFSGADLSREDQIDMEREGTVYCGSKHEFKTSLRRMLEIWNQELGGGCERPGW